MGLTRSSTKEAANTDKCLAIKKQSENDKVIALAGNPNVGKSTVFNNLTGLRQHTGNWPGKTVVNAQGVCVFNHTNYIMVDIPGCYSLMAHSAEEEVARNFICFGEPDAVIVVCDATCLERNMNLVLQTLEITPNVIVCVNLMDDAERKKIKIDLDLLSRRLGVPVVGTSASKNKGMDELMLTVEAVLQKEPVPVKITYSSEIEDAISIIEPVARTISEGKINARWLSLRLLDRKESLLEGINLCLGKTIEDQCRGVISEAEDRLLKAGINETLLEDIIVSALVHTAESVCRGVVTFGDREYNSRDRKIDKILTSKWTGFPIMFLLLAAIFWITITGANYPSELLSELFGRGEAWLFSFFTLLGLPMQLSTMLVLGVYKVLSWVISVMLPPMAIFFPLFTLLEDLGYLPRIAFNLDKCFKKCSACGKQCLTMCMGFGCNAAGIIGCRIIDSPRERLIAIITNNLVPCNGRFPTLIVIIIMFFTFSGAGTATSFLSALILAGIIVLGILATLFISWLLSKTLLKGVPSSFTLELPPFRRPQIGRVIVRSIIDRTLFVLGRAASVAAPAGLLIWLMANTSIGDATILTHCTRFLDPFAAFIGLDGVILMAFILGFPANEIVIPIILMAYLAKGQLVEYDSVSSLKTILTDNGWTWITACCTMLFSLMHWPCSTALITIKKETQSVKWTVAAFLIPTVLGIIVCGIFANIAGLFMR